MKTITIRLPDSEFDRLEAHCKSINRTKSEVLREFIRNLKI